MPGPEYRRAQPIKPTRRATTTTTTTSTTTTTRPPPSMGNKNAEKIDRQIDRPGSPPAPASPGSREVGY